MKKVSSKETSFPFPKDIKYLVFDRRKKEENEFREFYGKKIGGILGHINNIRFIQEVFYLSKSDTTFSILEIALVNKAIDFISSSLVLLSHGSILESLTLLRIAIESSCSALLIHFDDDEREKFLSDMKAFRSSKAITYAKKKVKYVGKLYGILSKVAVHVNAITFGPKVVEKDKEGNKLINIQPFFIERAREDKKAFLLLIHLVTFIVERINEIITIEEMDNKITIGEKEYRYLSCSEHSIERMYKEFDEIIRAPLVSTQ